MSKENTAPTAEQIISARARGVGDSVAYMPEARRNKIIKSHSVQSGRRDKNVSGFRSAIRGGS